MSDDAYLDRGFSEPLDHFTDIGDDHSISFTTRGDEDRAGLLVQHRRPDNGRWCVGSILFYGRAVDLAGPRWSLLSEAPLHVEPSLLCGCGDHGFIRDGRWVRA